jgi:hypothetical protein
LNFLVVEVNRPKIVLRVDPISDMLLTHTTMYSDA